MDTETTIISNTTSKSTTVDNQSYVFHEANSLKNFVCPNYTSKNYIPKIKYFSHGDTVKSFNLEFNPPFEKSSETLSEQNKNMVLSYYLPEDNGSQSNNSTNISQSINNYNNYNINFFIQFEGKKKQNQTDGFRRQSYCKSSSFIKKEELMQRKNFQKFEPSTEEDLSYESIKTKYGCAFYQEKIKKDHLFANTHLYPGLIPYMFQLINDQYGNYLYQLLLDVLFEEKLEHLISFILDNFSKISFNQYGTRVVQKLIDKINFTTEKGMELYTKIFSKISNHVCEMSVDAHANHIIRKIITVIDPAHTDPIYEEIYSSFEVISTTKNGCCVIQKCLMHGSENQKQRVIELILQNAFYLIKDQFGNYICQCLILNFDDWTVAKLFNITFGNIFYLCDDKYSSNVIEKFFEIKNKKLINEFANRMLKFDSRITELVYNRYGNYIISKIIFAITDESLRERIFKVIFENIKNVNELPYGKKLLLSLICKFPELKKFCS